MISAQSQPEYTVKSSAALEEMHAGIDLTKTVAPINRYVYGMFTELLRNIFEFGLWAEMLNDRKFFYHVDTSSKLNPVNTRWFQNRWRPVSTGSEIIHIELPVGFYAACLLNKNKVLGQKFVVYKFNKYS